MENPEELQEKLFTYIMDELGIEVLNINGKKL